MTNTNKHHPHTPTPTRAKPTPTPTLTPTRAKPTLTLTRAKPTPTPTLTRAKPTPTLTRAKPTPTRAKPTPTPTLIQGFGVIELALILVVLGTLVFYLLERNPPTGVSETAFSRDFVLAWVMMADHHAEQTGRVLGDGRGNGGWRGIVDGRADGIYLPEAGPDIQEELVATLDQAGLTPCSAVRTARRDVAVQVCDGRDIFQAQPGGRGIVGTPSGVGFARVFMPETEREANVIYFEHVPLEVALEAARAIDSSGKDSRTLLFPQPKIARWHARDHTAPQAFTAQPRPARDFDPQDFVRLGVVY